MTMKNELQFTDTVTTVFALSALKRLTDDTSLPGPLGRDEEPAIIELAAICFRRLCAELGYEALGNTVELPADCHDLLEAVVADRVVARLTGAPEPEENIRRLRCRLRRRPGGPVHRY